MFDRLPNPLDCEVTIINRRYFCEHFILVVSGVFRSFCDFSINFGKIYLEDEIKLCFLLDCGIDFNMVNKRPSTLLMLVSGLVDTLSGSCIFTIKMKTQAQENSIPICAAFIVDIDF